jgi:hypothetical protein
VLLRAGHSLALLVQPLQIRPLHLQALQAHKQDLQLVVVDLVGARVLLEKFRK